MMETTMKVMIAYDGSTFAEAAIRDLPRAGLPQDCEVLLVSVADFSTNSPHVSDFDILSAASRRIDSVLAKAKLHEDEVLNATRQMAEDAVGRIGRQFPGWKINYEVLRGEPAESLLKKAEEWKPDLAMGGSQGRSAIGRFFFGSVSKSFAKQSRTSVRVVRPGPERNDADPIEIILGAKNPAEAERLVAAVGPRAWPAATRIRLVAIDPNAASGGVAAFYPNGESIYKSVAECLSALGLWVSVQIETGDPKTALLNAGETWAADAIFVVAGSSNDRSELDETALGLVTSAKCTVEVIR